MEKLLPQSNCGVRLKKKKRKKECELQPAEFTDAAYQKQENEVQSSPERQGFNHHLQVVFVSCFVSFPVL